MHSVSGCDVCGRPVYPGVCCLDGPWCTALPAIVEDWDCFACPLGPDDALCWHHPAVAVARSHCSAQVRKAPSGQPRAHTSIAFRPTGIRLAAGSTDGLGTCRFSCRRRVGSRHMGQCQQHKKDPAVTGHPRGAEAHDRVSGTEEETNFLHETGQGCKTKPGLV